MLEVWFTRTNLSVITVYCNLSIAPHGEKMQRWIILAVNQSLLVAIIGQMATKNLCLPAKIIYIYIFLDVNYSGQVATYGCDQ